MYDDIRTVYVIDSTRGIRHFKDVYKLKGDWHSLNLTCCKFLTACDFGVLVSFTDMKFSTFSKDLWTILIWYCPIFYARTMKVFYFVFSAFPSVLTFCLATSKALLGFFLCTLNQKKKIILKDVYFLCNLSTFVLIKWNFSLMNFESFLNYVSTNSLIHSANHNWQLYV